MAVFFDERRIESEVRRENRLLWASFNGESTRLVLQMQHDFGSILISQPLVRSRRTSSLRDPKQKLQRTPYIFQPDATIQY